MGNHYCADLSWNEAKAILEASSLWEVHERPEDTAISVRFLFKEEGRDEDHDWMSLYYNNDPKEQVKAENLPYPLLMLALELSLRVRFIDLPCYGQYTPWYRVRRWDEATYNRHLVEVAEVLGMDPDLPTWNPEILAGMAAEEARLIAEAEHMQTLTPAEQHAYRLERKRLEEARYRAYIAEGGTRHPKLEAYYARPEEPYEPSPKDAGFPDDDFINRLMAL